jgi:uncharacterized protein
MTLIFYQDAGKEWRWRLVAANGRILCVSSEGYDSKANVKRAWLTVCEGLVELLSKGEKP